MDNMFAAPVGSPMEHVRVGGAPALYIVALHRLARLGQATTYGGNHNRLVEFNLETKEGEQIKEKWPPLRDATRVWLIYRDRRIVL